ncbi:nitrate regulatory protein [Telmatospirillum sp. J64-1]|uniref:nitrate regulatory protein n=1 Tax=Telmatospirillum sp. J64-1 TaxID=2502183 RepID=UPI00115C70BE|nr:nitrate regulatory protein [Telmatospirillum sp. J64-1]
MVEDLRTPQSGSALRFLISAKQSEIRSLEQLAVMSELVQGFSVLTHAMQKERGLSSLYLGSRGGRFADQLAQHVSECLKTEQSLRLWLDRFVEDSGSMNAGARLLSRIAYVLHKLDALPGIRAQIRRLAIAPQDVVTAFSEIVAGLLAVVFEAADTAADPEVSRALVALFNLMQGKEFAGQERAIGAAGFALGRFEAAQHQRFLHLIEAQHRSLQIFSEFAQADQAEFSRDILSGPEIAEFERMRRLACVGGLSGELKGVESTAWFDQATRRIDAMRCVEERLAGDLQVLCTAKLEKARADLHSQYHHLESLTPGTATDSTQSVAIFLGKADPALIEGAIETGVSVYSVDGLSPQLGRSILDLVQAQSRRLQDMSDELKMARAALNERKVVERAKGLLITHRGLTEDQAYKLLRQMAMNQNKRLVEVAEAALAMADVLKK